MSEPQAPIGDIWTNILDKITHAIEKYELFEKKDRVLVAVSGGPDSVFLAYVLHHQQYDIGIAHVNYQLRGEESEAEAALVQKIAHQWNIPVYIKTHETEKLLTERKDSLQMLARELRYTFFEETMNKEGYQYCATAHHADDQAESIIFSLLKGNSADFVKAIPYKRERYVRPLLGLNKTEIEMMCQHFDLPFLIDSSNMKEDYARNKIRHSVIPALKHLHPNPGEQLVNRTAWYEFQSKWMNSILNQWKERCMIDSFTLDWKEFEMEFGRKYIPLLLVYVFEQWGIHGHELWEGTQLYKLQVGKKILTKKGALWRTREGIQWSPTSSEYDQEVVPHLIIEEIKEETKIHWNNCQLTFYPHYVDQPVFGLKNVFFLDQDKISFPLKIRHWHTGDRMVPFGMNQQKKLSDIFIDEKFSLQQKQQAVIMEDQHHILLVSDFRIDHRVRLGEHTRRVLRVDMCFMTRR